MNKTLNQINEIENLKARLKHVTSIKMKNERNVLKLRNKERSLLEDLCSIKVDIEIVTAQLEELKDELAETAHHINTMEIHIASEKSRLDSRILDVESHKKGFSEMFEKEKAKNEMKMKALKNKEKEDLEREKLRKLEITEKNDLQQREIVNMERECESIEKECTILKKRNNAIMLKLRRKLIETEEARRQMMNKTRADEQHSIGHIFE